MLTEVDEFHFRWVFRAGWRYLAELGRKRTYLSILSNADGVLEKRRNLVLRTANLCSTCALGSNEGTAVGHFGVDQPSRFIFDDICLIPRAL